MEFEPVIGLEVHAQLLTRSKMFCGCSAAYADAPPNTHVCPVCMGAPGVMPVINEEAVRDTVKLLHRSNADGAYSLMDINRSGVPLIEIVSAPDLHSPEQARAYAQTLRSVLQYLGVNAGDMEKGSLRCDANISLRPKGTTGLGVKTEVKNMNSFRALQAALAYEVRRQAEILRSGGTLVQETRGWDEARGETLPQRSKEFAHDYRYFPEPDLPPLEFSPAYVEEVRASLPELADARRARLVAQYGLPEADAATITASKALADFYEAAVAAVPDGAARTVANYLLSDVGGLLNAQGIEID